MAGFFATRAGLPDIPDAPFVRSFQHRQLRIALPWAARVLGLPPPDGDWCRHVFAATDHALHAGEIDPTTWHARREQALTDAYLTTDDPHRGSGKSGDATDWRWSRELVLNAVSGTSAHILDVGSANGHLMDSLERWGAERGLAITAHGVEISERLAALSRRRLPHLAPRIHLGNVLTWMPPRRYDVVHTGLDYVPEPTRRELVQRIRADFLTAGGRLVLRAERVGGREHDPSAALRACGLEPSGTLQAIHPRTGAVRRTAWIGATA